MNVTLAYQGHSGLRPSVGGRSLTLVPNLARDRVSFDAGLAHPVRFREAFSALHDVVSCDLRFKPRDKTAYREWVARQRAEQMAVWASAYHSARAEVLARRAAAEVSDAFQERYGHCRREYWRARNRLSRQLMLENLDWGAAVPAGVTAGTLLALGLSPLALLPLDPIITVAEDVVFFECFSADESTYACLTVQRERGFSSSADWQVGTTNIDYSTGLYEQIQSLRSYRPTRLKVDPEGFEVATGGHPDYREERIDLPPSWLQGFLQIQAALSLPLRQVTLTREAVYSLLAFLKRHRAKTSPRAIRFELNGGVMPQLVLEPWEKVIPIHGASAPLNSQLREDHAAEAPGPIRIWGRDRLQVLARVLPLAQRFDVYLLGTGLPSFWVADLGEMRLTVGLSGWTTNDWTRGSGLDLLGPPVTPQDALIDRVAWQLKQQRDASLEQLVGQLLCPAQDIAAALNTLALRGQTIYDLHARRYRWRQILDQPVDQLNRTEEHPEVSGCRMILARRNVRLEGDLSDWHVGGGRLQISGKVDGRPVQLELDADDRIRGGKCNCHHFFSYGLRRGPCRHLLAARWVVRHGEGHEEGWYDRLLRWSGHS